MLRIALLQMTAHGYDQEANRIKGEAFCRQAAAAGADIALFPEMWNVGYTFKHAATDDDPNAAAVSGDRWRAPRFWSAEERAAGRLLNTAIRAYHAMAIDRDGPFVSHFRALARELGMAIALTYLERWPGAPRNTVSLIDRHGEIALTYAKVHTCDFDFPEASLSPGDDFYVCTLDTVEGDVQIGAMICYDREFPESARVLMLKGAEIILTPNACHLEANRIAQLRTRAYENMVGVAMTNYPGPGWGRSMAFSPVSHDRQGRARENLLIEAGEAEGIYMAPFDLEEMRDYRARAAWGNAFRRPHRYGALTAPEVAEPFIRVNAAGERFDLARR